MEIEILERKTVKTDKSGKGTSGKRQRNNPEKDKSEKGATEKDNSEKGQLTWDNSAQDSSKITKTSGKDISGIKKQIRNENIAKGQF